MNLPKTLRKSDSNPLGHGDPDRLHSYSLLFVAESNRLSHGEVELEVGHFIDPAFILQQLSQAA